MTRIPKYRHHKGSNQALVELGGKPIYLGRYGTPESKERYERLIAEFLHNGRRLPEWVGHRRDRPGKSAVLVVNVIARYWEHAKRYYVTPEGRPTTTVSDIKQAMRPLRALYGHTAADGFGPKKLLVVRQRMIEQGWNRSTVNDRIKWVKRMFAWATENELVPGKVWHDLKAVASLKAGRSEAPEPRKVKPVSQERVDAIRPYVSRQVWALIQLQLLTGARGGEIVIMRALDIDMSGKVWLYRPATHKTAYRGSDRVIYIGPEAQETV